MRILAVKQMAERVHPEKVAALPDLHRTWARER
jgi:hypothetical protein